MAKMSKPYYKGKRWYIKLPDGYEMEFPNDEEAWKYYDKHNE